MQELIFGSLAPKGQQVQQAGSPRVAPETPQEPPRQAQPSPQLATGQASPPSLPSPLPMRSPGSSSPSNMPLDHLLMLANMTNTQPEEWNASPRMRNQMPNMQGSGFKNFPAYRRALSLLLPHPPAGMLSYTFKSIVKTTTYLRSCTAFHLLQRTACGVHVLPPTSHWIFLN